MATIAATQVTLDGVALTATAANAGGDKVPTGDTAVAEVANASGSPITVTANSLRSSGQGSDEDMVVTVPDGATRTVGPLPAWRYADADGLASLTYSATPTSVTIAPWRL